MELGRRELLFAAAVGFELPQLVQARGAPSIAAMLSSIIAKTVRDGAAAGAALGVASRGKVLLDRGFGFANLETQTPVSADTVFRIGSCTKQFTAAAVLLLAEHGKLSLDEPIGRYFQDFPKGQQVTIEQLLNHTSGIHDYVSGGFPTDAGDGWRLDPERHRFFARMTPVFDFEPGTHWLYSNSGYALLGEIVEKASGQPYGAYVKTNLFDPAGMSTTALDNADDVVPRRASGYALRDGKAGSFRNDLGAGLPIAEGGIRSTVGDLLRWNRALYGGKILAPASLARMTAPARVNSGLPVGQAHFVPKGQKPGAPPPFVQDPDYGLGLEVCKMFGQPVFWHSGGIPGFNALLFRFVAQEMDVALLTNTDNGVVPAFEPMLRAALHGGA
jgi:CubicO group peptidase (beta-lactamase class C family)